MEIIENPYGNLFRDTQAYIEETLLPTERRCGYCESLTRLTTLDDLKVQEQLRHPNNYAYWAVFYTCPVCSRVVTIAMENTVLDAVNGFLRSRWEATQQTDAETAVTQPWWRRVLCIS